MKPIHFILIVFAMLALLSGMIGCTANEVKAKSVYPEQKILSDTHGYRISYEVYVFDNMRYLIVNQNEGALQVINLTKDSLEVQNLKRNMKVF